MYFWKFNIGEEVSVKIIESSEVTKAPPDIENIYKSYLLNQILSLNGKWQ